MFIFKRLLIFDINVYNNFEYVHVKFERKNYFYDKIMIIRKKKRRHYYQNMIKKINEGLDF